MNLTNWQFFVQSTKAMASLAAAIVLSACAGAGPYNSISDGADSVLMLKGHDPVAYFTLGKHTLGKPEIKATYEGATYRFVSDEHKALFATDPAKYVPQYGGFCSNGAAYGIPWGGDPDTWKIVDGKLYIFGGEGSRKYFLMDEKKNIQFADKYWRDEIKGSSGFVQRYYRLLVRVPHYKTGAQLEAEWQQAQSGKVGAPK